MPAVVRFDNVSKLYRRLAQKPFLASQVWRRLTRRTVEVAQHSALENINLEIESGESVGIIGPNGSGKSTLLSIVAGTTYPTKGEVQVHGRIGPLLELGAGFHPDLTGWENIYLNASLLGLSRAEVEEKIDSIIEYAGIGEFIHSSVRTYSAGMGARLGFAVLAHMEPDILLVDESLSVGDASFRSRCERTMMDFRERGTTLLLVSHDLPTVERLCDRLIWLDAGKIRGDGSPAQVLDAYRAEPNRQFGVG